MNNLEFQIPQSLQQLCPLLIAVENGERTLTHCDLFGLLLREGSTLFYFFGHIVNFAGTHKVFIPGTYHLHFRDNCGTET